MRDLWRAVENRRVEQDTIFYSINQIKINATRQMQFFDKYNTTQKDLLSAVRSVPDRKGWVKSYNQDTFLTPLAHVLITARESDIADMVITLIEYGVDLNRPVWGGEYYLGILVDASIRDFSAITFAKLVRLFLKHGADMYRQSKKKQSMPMLRLLKQRNAEMIIEVFKAMDEFNVPIKLDWRFVDPGLDMRPDIKTSIRIELEGMLLTKPNRLLSLRLTRRADATGK